MAQLKNTIVGHQTQWNRLLDLAQAGKLPGAMAFVGPEGVGKSLVAKALLEELGCSLESGSIVWVQASGEMIKVDQIHEMLQKLSLRSLSPFRFVVFEEAERLNPQSSNALLKVLEEPPERTHFILLTSSLSRLLPTIRSRVQNFRFFPLTADELKSLRADSPDWVFHLARGQVSEMENWQSEDAESFLKTAEASLRALGQRDLGGWVEQFSFYKERESAHRFSKVLQFFFRDLIQNSSSLPFTEGLRPTYQWSPFQLTEAWQKAFDLEMNIVQNGDRSLLLQNYFYEIHQNLV